MIPPSAMAQMYSPSTSFQSLLANISAVPRPPPQVQSSKPLMVPDNVISSPPTSPTVGLSLVTGGVSSPSSHQQPPQQPSPPQVSQRSDTPPEDRRSSSIAALRLKAREHELKLEMLRQNGHAHTDILS